MAVGLAFSSAITISISRRDLEGQAAAGRAVYELIGRLERVGMEAERRTCHAFGGRGVGLELIVMARRQDRSAALSEMIHDGDAERPAFDGIGAGPHLVQ